MRAHFSTQPDLWLSIASIPESVSRTVVIVSIEFSRLSFWLNWLMAELSMFRIFVSSLDVLWSGVSWVARWNVG